MARPVGAGAWASALGVSENAVPGVLFGLVRTLRDIDERVMNVRNLVHSGPDPDLDTALLVMERAAHEATAQIEDAHREVARDA
ncbi:hypothetical protein [Janibacter alittae]|uniref:Uncharacterized protein n=1 Tax=Janibacter alittae TaxID=3115209 RepID=A0ABZ2MIC3_9MICO